jgi:hypothetical protein
VGIEKILTLAAVGIGAYLLLGRVMARREGPPALSPPAPPAPPAPPEFPTDPFFCLENPDDQRCANYVGI